MSAPTADSRHHRQADTLAGQLDVAHGFMLAFLEEQNWRKAALACYRELKRHIPFTQILFTSLDTAHNLLTPWIIVEDDTVIPLYLSKEIEQSSVDDSYIAHHNDKVDIFLENDIEHCGTAVMRQSVYLKGKQSLLTLRVPVDNNTVFLVSLQSVIPHCFTQNHVDILVQLQDVFRMLTSKLFTSSHKNLLYRSQQEKARESSLAQLKQCQGLDDIVERLEMVAPTDSTVLIRGESGVGKELVANSLHQLSHRVRGPLVKVNCAALPESLLESMLFGHEKGAFTGATQTHEGYFEQADGGTLFLDEIGELSPAAQARLLRVIETHSIERLGAVRSTPVDVRLIAATHCDLRQMVVTGRFRRDLWFRINVFPMEIPSLRSRREDIVTLAHFLYTRLVKELKLSNPPALTAEAESMLRAYVWPGNVRELSHVLQHALIVGSYRHERELKLTREYFEAEDFWEAPRDTTSPNSILKTTKPEGPSRPDIRAGALPSATTLDRGMADIILSALNACDGHVHGPGGAAARLGINPSTLRSRMVRLGIPLPGGWRKKGA